MYTRKEELLWWVGLLSAFTLLGDEIEPQQTLAF